MNKNIELYDLAVIGAGPAGMMAAITATSHGLNTILIERNSSPGRKLLLTGNGRCNITNNASLNEFIEKFGRRGSFLRTAFTKFSNKDLIEFFESRGLEFKEKENGRVFPVTDDSKSVLKILETSMKKLGVKTVYNTRLTKIQKIEKKNIFIIKLDYNTVLKAKKVVLATGGLSYQETGSSGDGFRIAEELQHGITPLNPGIVPLKTKESWIKSLQGIRLDEVKITIKNPKMILDGASLLFTHFGVSGPLILDNSSKIIPLLEYGNVDMILDLKPSSTREELQEMMVAAFESHGKVDLKNYMKLLITNRMIPIILKLTNIDGKKKMNQINKNERNSIINLIKSFPITIRGYLSLDKAVITCGGISRDYINPNTMESKVVNGLYFAGEIIQGCASSGGYNLQQAFSTGYLAGLLSKLD
ncbi:MAG: NAD(P)/FAD-dependent oxidoreductase [Methanobacterium sp.]|nr:NAD(P)/FAD-dependent oxidoreductase [Methanobacterium sp.]